jgi:hypothetical protein
MLNPILAVEGSPSALLLEWMAHIRMSFDAVWDRSPLM